jgi:V/A-type H+/Na+-transporting ATPase subunit I
MICFGVKMFYPQAMTELEMVVPAKDLLAVTKILSGKGLFHQIDSSYLTSEKGVALPNIWQDKTTAYSSLERRLQIIMQALNVDEGQPPSVEFEEMADIDTLVPDVDAIEAEVKKISDQLVGETRKLEQLDGALNQLEPIAGIELDISTLRNQRYLFSTLGIIPVGNIARLQESLSRVPFFFLTLREDNQKAVVWLAGARANSEILERAIRSAYLIPLVLPDGHQGTPSEIIKDLLKNKEESQSTISRLKNDLVKIKEQRLKFLQTHYWEVHASRIMSDAILRFGRLKYTYLIVGWTPSKSLADLTQRVKLASKEVLIETFPIKRGGGQQDVPVDLKHARILDPFQMMVTTYSRPRYNELDPTLLIAVTFPVIYGAMFGDVGQGIILALLGFLLTSRKVKMLRSMAALGGLVTACGLAATVFGFLYGSVFGFEDILHPIWMHPLDNIMLILEIAIGAGVVLLSIGFIIGVINAITSRNWGQLLFERSGLPGLLLYWSVLALAANAALKITILPSIIFIILAVYGAVAIMFSELFINLLEGHRPLIGDSISTFAIQAFFELFETFISLLSNSLSYVRIGAFAVAHGGLSNAIFILAALVSPGHGIGYGLVLIGGNLFIILFEGLIVGIQTMRLEYYEFFSKFFVGGGKRYEPLTLRPIVDE